MRAARTWAWTSCMGAAAAVAIAAAAHAQVPVAAPSTSGPSASVSAPSSSAAPSTPAPVASSSAPAPSSLASAPTSGPALDGVTAPNVRPFGPGLPVTISCDRAFSYAFVAKGAVDSRPSFPDPFVKIGRLPLTIELPSGVYTVIVEGEMTTSGSSVFEVRNMPAQIRVKGGSASLRELSTWTMAFGAAAVLAGTVLELSRSANEDSKQKNAIAIPLFIGGGVALGGGIAMVLVSRTTFQNDAFVPGQSGGPAARFRPGLAISGHF